MRPWVILTTVFFLGLGLGLSGPMLASRYLNSYLPAFLKDTMHPLEGSVTYKQRQEDRLLVTITTQDGSILATFQRQVPEIDLLIEEQDLVTLDVQKYEPFIHDPTLLRVTKHKEMNPALAAPPNPSIPSAPTKESGSMIDSPGSAP
ncbi:MAG: hypothetical protein NPIRA06_02310 [Nitrospirales bacterium]|nr:MAG: hypothetical protein NPIRA06_02310 [Nitrospirales bacterium]